MYPQFQKKVKQREPEFGCVCVCVWPFITDFPRITISFCYWGSRHRDRVRLGKSILKVRGPTARRIRNKESKKESLRNMTHAACSTAFET